MKKFASLVLVAVMLATMLTVFAVPASAVRDPDRYSANASYKGKWAVFTYSEPEIEKFYYIIGVNGMEYHVASYEQCGSGWKKSEHDWDKAYFLYLVSTESIPAEVRAMAENDYPNLSPTGSTLSEGSLATITAVAGLAVGFLVAMFIFKKKKPALASGENTDEE